MLRKLATTALTAALILTIAVPALADPGQPTFGPALFADGRTWGTKGTTSLPEPTNNIHSYDKLFVFANGADGQLPVAEAAPGNPAYNGGRWYAHSVEWTDAGAAAHASLPVLTSYAEVMLHYELGHLSITPGSGPGAFFQCPLLPVK